MQKSVLFITTIKINDNHTKLKEIVTKLNSTLVTSLTALVASIIRWQTFCVMDQRCLFCDNVFPLYSADYDDYIVQRFESHRVQ